jgi:hypothetical protein
MVITNTIGGLGNQMFQYAAGRALSLEHGVPLCLDISGFSSYGLHQGFELQHIFNCAAGIATASDKRDILGWQSSRHIRKLLLRKEMALFRRKELVVEPHFNYWPGIKHVSHDCYLLGYWQSEKYFSESAWQIRIDFTFRQSLERENERLAQQINSVNAVSLHVRRGDYAKNPQTAATHGLCTLDYYRHSIRYVAERVHNPSFFLFSDDMAWVRDNLNIPFPCKYVDCNRGEKSYNDMRLMSMCNHHIIANSSFSWWGAWLNPKLDKIVVAPKNWFSNQTYVRDLLPQSWVKL